MMYPTSTLISIQMHSNLDLNLDTDNMKKNNVKTKRVFSH